MHNFKTLHAHFFFFFFNKNSYTLYSRLSVLINAWVYTDNPKMTRHAEKCLYLEAISKVHGGT